MDERPWRFGLWQVTNVPEYFAYTAGNGADGVCLIERIDLPDGRIAIVCIETAGNPGMSITNAVERICHQVCKRFVIPPQRLVWLEHYDLIDPPEWQMVRFGRYPPDGPFERPEWTEMTSALWRSLSLSPRRKLKMRYGRFESKVRKLFDWPVTDSDAIL